MILDIPKACASVDVATLQCASALSRKFRNVARYHSLTLEFKAIKTEYLSETGIFCKAALLLSRFRTHPSDIRTLIQHCHWETVYDSGYTYVDFSYDGELVSARRSHREVVDLARTQLTIDKAKHPDATHCSRIWNSAEDDTVVKEPYCLDEDHWIASVYYIELNRIAKPVKEMEWRFLPERPVLSSEKPEFDALSTMDGKVSAKCVRGNYRTIRDEKGRGFVALKSKGEEHTMSSSY